MARWTGPILRSCAGTPTWRSRPRACGHWRKTEAAAPAAAGPPPSVRHMPICPTGCAHVTVATSASVLPWQALPERGDAAQTWPASRRNRSGLCLLSADTRAVHHPPDSAVKPLWRHDHDRISPVCATLTDEEPARRGDGGRIARKLPGFYPVILRSVAVHWA